MYFMTLIFMSQNGKTDQKRWQIVPEFLWYLLNSSTISFLSFSRISLFLMVSNFPLYITILSLT